MCNVQILKSTRKQKKFMAVFTDCKDDTKKITHFGASGYSDYTIHKNKERKQRYLNRHRKNENWEDPFSAGALSRWILWNKTGLRSSISDYKTKFCFE